MYLVPVEIGLRIILSDVRHPMDIPIGDMDVQIPDAIFVSEMIDRLKVMPGIEGNAGD